MKKYFITVLSVLVLFVLSSCKEDDPPPSEYSATITFIEPDAGAVFNGGDELHIEVDFENNDIILNVEVIALDLTSDDTLFYFSSSVNTANLYQFHDHTDLPVVGGVTQGRVTASTWDDNKAEAITKSVNFTINP